MKFVDFNTVYGKIGATPGYLTTSQAVALFRHAMENPPGAKFVEYWPDGGRSTALLSAAAKNLSGSVSCHPNWSVYPPQAEQWFNRTVKTHKIAFTESMNGKQVDMAVIRPGYINTGAPISAAKVFVLGQVELPGWTLVEKGQDFTVWKGGQI